MTFEQWWVEYRYSIGTAWLIFSFIGLWMRAQQRDFLNVSDLFFSIMIAPLYFLDGFSSWDAVIWKRNKKD